MQPLRIMIYSRRGSDSLISLHKDRSNKNLLIIRDFTTWLPKGHLSKYRLISRVQMTWLHKNHSSKSQLTSNVSMTWLLKGHLRRVEMKLEYRWVHQSFIRKKVIETLRLKFTIGQLTRLNKIAQSFNLIAMIQS